MIKMRNICGIHQIRQQLSLIHIQMCIRDRAYNKRLANLAGYIVCQQTNDGSKFFQTTNGKKNTAEQKEYIDTAVSMMEKAQKRFLEMREEQRYTAGIAQSVIWDMMSSDKNFMETTQWLFAKTIYHNT